MTGRSAILGPTAERVLESACEVFAEKGYQNATVADICERAQANVASVNYYFGDKEHLYEAVWRHAYEHAAEAHPLDGGLPDDAPAEQRLHGAVTAYLRRILSGDATGHFTRLVVREMAQPTRALDAIVAEVMRPQAEYMRGTVRDLIGGDVPEETVTRCMFSVISQCVSLAFNKPVRDRLQITREVGPACLEDLASHITRFSLGGIREAGSQSRGAGA